MGIFQVKKAKKAKKTAKKKAGKHVVKKKKTARRTVKKTKKQVRKKNSAVRRTAPRVSQKMIDEVVSEVAGPDVVQLVNVLRNKSKVSEFMLADQIKCEINQTRNMLYRLYENNLVSFIRRKDKKKGWYIYYWTFSTPRIREIYINLKKQLLARLQDRLEREKNTQFYVCCQMEHLPNGKVVKGPVTMRLDFDKAMAYEFKCPETGQLLELEDNSERIAQIEKDIAKVKKELAAL